MNPTQYIVTATHRDTNEKYEYRVNALTSKAAIALVLEYILGDHNVAEARLKEITCK